MIDPEIIDNRLRASTLFDWPGRQAQVFEANRLCVVSAPTDRGNPIARGTAHGPMAIRRASLGLEPPRVEGVDWGDIEGADASDLTEFLDRLARVTALIYERNLCPLLLGGDHSTTFATVSVLQGCKEICLVWLDAHTDFSPWSGRGSHNHKQVLRRISELGGVRRIVQIGYRGITLGDERQLGPKAVVVTSARARSLSAQALLTLIPAHLPCYISIDIDVVDPLWAPGTSAPVPDGLLPEEVRSMLGTIVRNRQIAGVDLVEVNPKLDVRGATSVVAAELIHEIADNWGGQLAQFGQVGVGRSAPSAATDRARGSRAGTKLNTTLPASTESYSQVQERASLMHATQIPSYDFNEFRALVQASPDVLAEHPCVIRGLTEQWPASRRWTSLQYLSEAFGHLPVTAGAPQFTTHKHARMCQVKTDFGTYLKYVQNPADVEALFRDQWSKGDASVLRELDLPLYCGNLRIVRHSREKVFSEIDPLVPAPLEHLNDHIPYYYQCGNHFWLYVSLAGALTPLHQDNNTVFAYLGQLQGQKSAILYSPSDKRHFYSPAVGYLDPLHPNDEEFPTWREARPWTALLNPGELLIWGPSWAHHVVTLSNSITVSFDFVNFMNLDSYSLSMDWRCELGLFARKNAELIRARIQDARVLDALEAATEDELGKEVMICVLRAALESDLPEQSRRVKERMLRALSVGAAS